VIRQHDRWLRLAVTVWVVLVAAVGARVLLASSPRSHSVYPIYSHAGLAWRAGDDLYAPVPDLDQFRYAPPVAAAFAPWSLLPDRFAGLLWRLLGVAAFLAGLGWWRRAVLPLDLSPNRRGVLLLAAAPLALQSLNNGQLNLPLIGLLLLGTAAVAAGRWNLAAGLIAAAVLLKVYPLAVGLLIAVVHPRRFGPRFAVALAAGLALPFVLQDPAYVAGQYRRWVWLLGADDRLHATLERSTRDLYLLLRVWLVPPGAVAYGVIQLGAAAGMALVCLAARGAGWPARERLALVLDLGCLWMVLLGRGTESCTYTLLAPTAAGCLLRGGRLGWVAAVSLGLLYATILRGAFPDDWRFQALGPQPFAALLLLAALTAGALGRLARPAAPAAPDADRRWSFVRLIVSLQEFGHDRAAVADRPRLQRSRPPAAVPRDDPPTPH
jgi:hypothetical protein